MQEINLILQSASLYQYSNSSIKLCAQSSFVIKKLLFVVAAPSGYIGLNLTEIAKF